MIGEGKEKTKTDYSSGLVGTWVHSKTEQQ